MKKRVYFIFSLILVIILFSTPIFATENIGKLDKSNEEEQAKVVSEENTKGKQNEDNENDANIENTQKEVQENYDNLKIKLSELDADYRVAVENTSNKVIVVGDSALKYLEKFGLTVYCIDSDATQKTIADCQELFSYNTISYIYTFAGTSSSDIVNNMLAAYPDVSKVELHKLDNISDQERRDKLDYVTISRNNLELIKKELYQ